MTQAFAFVTTMTAVSGENASCLREELPAVINVIGRIHPTAVSDYFQNIKKSEGEELIVSRLNEPGLPKSCS